MLRGELPDLDGCLAFLDCWRGKFTAVLRHMTGDDVLIPQSRNAEAVVVRRGRFVRLVYSAGHPFEREMLIRSVVYATDGLASEIEVSGWFGWFDAAATSHFAAHLPASPVEYGRLIVRGYNVFEHNGELHAGVAMGHTSILALVRKSRGLQMVSCKLADSRPLGRSLGRLRQVEC